MDDKNQIFRNIPQVEKILQEERVRRYVPEIGRLAVADIVRDVLAGVRATAEQGGAVSPEGIIDTVASRCGRMALRKLRRVINGTGVVVHTNLGRAPVSADLLGRLAAELSGYCNLEYDLLEGRRGGRGGFAESLMCALTGAEDALIVNNNASSVFLLLNEFAPGREVIVSRGELVQIGGGFRLPDIMRMSGARLVETGTTNITTVNDFRGAITEDTAMIFSCHRSNFTMEGFAEDPSLSELAALKSERIVFARDLGSGNLVDDRRLPRPFEPVVRAEVEQGADLVCFSGDKLLGGCQAGIIVGRKPLIARLRRNPLMRMLRVDKITYFILQETLLKYVNGEIDDIALWRVIMQDKKEIASRISRFIRLVPGEAKKRCITRIETRSVIGGGAMPGRDLESLGVRIDVPGLSADEASAAFIAAAVPVAGSIVDGGFILDFRTILDEDVPDAAAAAGSVFGRHCGGG